MTLAAVVALVLALAAAAFLTGFRRAGAMRADGRLHSLPVYHGMYAALWCALPALLFLAVWAPMQTRLVDQAVLSSPEA
ncbi:MAG TPA: phosphate ABC transporter permease family protein, partial [Sphingomicrobium sp.]|nr:phosphate ABC transporter permease family protein [Sphingomicrobium sp.]